MKPRVLFVDDEPNVLDGLRRMLHGHRDRWHVEFVTGAVAALEVLESGPVDAVVCDVKMPGMDGFELLSRLRAAPRTREVPFIVLTGCDDHGLKGRALDLGATDLLNKPVEPQDLIARLRSAIRLNRYQDRIRRHGAELERRVRQRTAELNQSRLDIIWRLGKAAEYRDEQTGDHVVRVGCSCRIIAEALGAEPDFVERLFLASPLHDIGKIGIPDAILRKRGPLTSDEWSVMKRHCAIGAAILRAESRTLVAFRSWRGGDDRDLVAGAATNPVLQMASTIAMTHHERWDGGGYPSGLSDEAIPLESRIVAVADVYDALRNARPYKPALSEEETLSVMRAERGAHFDPEVFAAFERVSDQVHAVQRELRDDADDPGRLEAVGCAT